MAPTEFLKRLQHQPFEPFELVYDDGQRFPVHRPNLAYLVPHGTIYLFQPLEDDREATASGPNIVKLDRVCEVAPL